MPWDVKGDLSLYVNIPLSSPKLTCQGISDFKVKILKILRYLNIPSDTKFGVKIPFVRSSIL